MFSYPLAPFPSLLVIKKPKICSKACHANAYYQVLNGIVILKIKFHMFNWNIYFHVSSHYSPRWLPCTMLNTIWVTPASQHSYITWWLTFHEHMYCLVNIAVPNSLNKVATGTRRQGSHSLPANSSRMERLASKSFQQQQQHENIINWKA